MNRIKIVYAGIRMNKAMNKIHAYYNACHPEESHYFNNILSGNEKIGDIITADHDGGNVYLNIKLSKEKLDGQYAAYSRIQEWTIESNNVRSLVLNHVNLI